MLTERVLWNLFQLLILIIADAFEFHLDFPNQIQYLKICTFH